LLRVIDHEAVLMDPKLFSSWVHRSVVLLKRRFGRQANSQQPVALLAKIDWIVQVIPQQAIKAMRVLSARKIVIGRPKHGVELHEAGAGMERFTTALGLYGGVLQWRAERPPTALREPILHEMVPSTYWDLELVVCVCGVLVFGIWSG
jgi:hypothetical protein